jgi:hypothetical protein
MKRTSITSVRDALNGYQKGKCFYSFFDISVSPKSPDLCHVDHFIPHSRKMEHSKLGANINGVWNLVLASKGTNLAKNAILPHRRYLERLHRRNEFFIGSKHPLAETIINQTGLTTETRRKFLETQYQVALNNSISTWTPNNELPSTF